MNRRSRQLLLLALLASVAAALAGCGETKSSRTPTRSTTSAKPSSPVVADAFAIQRAVVANRSGDTPNLRLYALLNRAARLPIKNGVALVRLRLPAIVRDEAAYVAPARRRLLALSLRTKVGEAFRHLALTTVDGWAAEIPHFAADVASSTTVFAGPAKRFSRWNLAFGNRIQQEGDAALAAASPEQRAALKRLVLHP